MLRRILAGMKLWRSNANIALILSVMCAALIVTPPTAHAQMGNRRVSAFALPQHAPGNDPREQRGADTPNADISIGLAVYDTSCYQLREGGQTCRGSLAGERMTGCGLSDGCHVTYIGKVVSLAHYVHERVALVGEVAFYSQLELTPTDGASSLVIGPRIKMGRVLGQVLIGRQWHSLFSDGLVVQPGVGIDVGGALGGRIQVDYPYFRPFPVLSGFRFQGAFVAHIGR